MVYVIVYMQITGDTMRAYESTHPWMTFTVNLSRAPARLWALLGECNALCGHMAGIALFPESQRELEQRYLARETLAITGIAPTVLSESDISGLIEGTSGLSPSRKYLAAQARNMLRGFGESAARFRSDGYRPLTGEVIAELNRTALDGLVLPAEIRPGEYRREDVEDAGRSWKPVPAEDVEHLVEMLCSWLSGRTFSPPPGMTVIYGILKAVFARAYLAWTQPFGDGNARTTGLVEYDILVSAGVPAIAAHMMGLFYHETEREYGYQFDRASTPDGKFLPFLVYAVQGFRDALNRLAGDIGEMQRDEIWLSYINEQFRGKSSPADLRRRQLAIELSRCDGPVSLPKILDTCPSLARSYAARTYKTLTRDVHDLVSAGLVVKSGDGFAADRGKVIGFRV